MRPKPAKENVENYALTIANTCIADVILSPVEIKNSFTTAVINTQAIWDTGATNSVITQKTAQMLGLLPVGKTRVRGVHGVQEVNVYHVKITLHNKSISVNTTVTECCALSPDNSIGMLIGMNIITMGDFAITNYAGATMMTFRIPSLLRMDFVKYPIGMPEGSHLKIIKE